MSPTSCSCWTAQIKVDQSRWQLLGHVALTCVVLVVLCWHPLAVWAKAVAVPAILLVAWLEWRTRMLVVALAYQPGELQLMTGDGSRWRVGPTAPAACHGAWMSVRAERGKQRCWITLFRDQMPEYHWRRLCVTLRWR